jgi:hypothetical protein
MKGSPTLPSNARPLWARLLLGAMALFAATFVYTTTQQGTYTTKHGLVVNQLENPAAYYYGLAFVGVFALVILYFAISPAKKK